MADELIPRKTAVSFVGGVSTKVDKYQIPFQKLASAQNVIFTSPGEVRTRYGYQALARHTLGLDRFTPSGAPPSLTTGQALMTYAQELVLCTALNLYSWDPGQQVWVLKAPCASVNVATSPVIQDNYNQSAPDENVAPNGTRMDAWQDSRGGTWYSVTNLKTGVQVVRPTLVHAFAVKPKVLQLAGTFVLLYVRTDTGKLYLASLPSADPSRSLSGSTNPVTGASPTTIQLSATNANYDACVMETATGPVLYVAFDNNVAAGGAGITTYGFVPSNLAAPAFGPAVEANLTPLALTCFADTMKTGVNALNGPAVAYSDNTNVKAFAWSYDLVRLTMPLTTVDNGGDAVPALTGVSVSDTQARRLDLYWTVYNSDSWKTLTRRATLDGATPTLIGPVVLRRSVGLASKAFAALQDGRTVSYVVTAYQSAAPTTPGFSGLQDTYFVVDSTNYIVARLFYGTAGGLPAWDVMSAFGFPMLPEVAPSTGSGPSTSSGRAAVVFSCALTFADFITTFPTTTPAPGTQVPLTAVFTQDGVVSCTFDFFNQQNSYLRAELGQTLLIGGGLLQSYDGQSVTENDFSQTPENIVLTQGTGGNLADGTYWYTFVWQWRNRAGELQQSGPAVPIPITIAAGGGTASVHAVVPTLRMTAKQAVTLMPYRSVLTGTVYHQAISTTAPASSGGSNAPILNVTNADTITFIDKLADANIASTPELYTTGNVIENLPTPPCSDLTVNFNRLFALGSDGTVWFSQQTLPNEPVQMSEWLFFSVDPRGGKVTALRALDQHTIVFKENLIMAVDGIGPDATGGQGNFQDAYIVTTDAGCIFPRSIGLGPEGLYFQSTKGAALLDRSLRVHYIGAEAEGLINENEITSAQLVSYTQQMRFTLNNGTLVGNDYFTMSLLQREYGQWFQHTDVNAVDAAIWQGTYCYLQPDGQVMQEHVPGPDTPLAEAMASFNDAGAFYGMKLVTPWYDLAGLNGWARTWWIYILGKVFSACTLRVDIAYDYDESVKQTVYIQIGPDAPYGTQGPYGTKKYGGSFPNVAWRVQPRQMLSSAFKLTLTVMQRGPVLGESIALSGLTFYWGEYEGPRQPNATATYG